MRRVAGVATGRRIVRDLTIVPDRAALAFELGATLARIHALTSAIPGLETLPAPHTDHALGAIADYRAFLDSMGDAHPAIEWGLRWCERHAPSPGKTALIHRDYRTGNYLVDDGHLAAILDWEFAGFGDPREDVGWFSARCWRFGAFDCEAGGLATIERFLDGYAALGGARASRDELHYWQLMAHLRWAVIALQQSRRHLAGGERSLELALTGRVVHELEHEIVRMTGVKPRPSKAAGAADAGTAVAYAAGAAAAGAPAPDSGPVGAAQADIADGANLLATAKETLETEVLPGLSPEQRYSALMVARAIAIALREQRMGGAAAKAESAGIAKLLDKSDQPVTIHRHRARCELTQAIRSGRFDRGTREDALVTHLAACAAREVGVSNPQALPEPE